MIPLTRLNRTPLYLNSDLIEHMESTPDTVISLISGNNVMVRESPEEIIDRIVCYRRRIAQPELAWVDGRRDERENVDA